MVNYLRNLGEYNKTVAAGVTSALAALSGIMGLVGFLPEKVAGTLLAAGAFLTTLSVFLVKNQDTIDKAGDAAANLIDRLKR